MWMLWPSLLRHATCIISEKHITWLLCETVRSAENSVGVSSSAVQISTNTYYTHNVVVMHWHHLHYHSDIVWVAVSWKRNSHNLKKNMIRTPSPSLTCSIVLMLLKIKTTFPINPAASCHKEDVSSSSSSSIEERQQLVSMTKRYVILSCKYCFQTVFKFAEASWWSIILKYWYI